MDFRRVVRRRRMVRNYSGSPISHHLLVELLDLARNAPSAGFSQGQSFVAVTDPAVKGEIARIVSEPSYVARGFDPWVSRAGAIVICCTSERLYRDRYREPDKLRPDGTPIDWPIPYWFFDAGAATMTLLLAAVDAGLAAGFLGADEAGYAKIKQLLSIPEHVTPVGIVTIGHPAPDRRSGSLKRGWRPIDEVIHFESWGRGPQS